MMGLFSKKKTYSVRRFTQEENKAVADALSLVRATETREGRHPDKKIMKALNTAQKNFFDKKEVTAEDIHFIAASLSVISSKMKDEKKKASMQLAMDDLLALDGGHSGPDDAGDLALDALRDS